MNAFASSMISCFGQFLTSYFGGLYSLEDIKKFYCFLLLNLLNGDEELLKELLLSEGDHRPSELPKAYMFINVLKPMTARDLLFKTKILFQACTRVRLALFDGSKRVASAWMAAIGIRPDNFQCMKFGRVVYTTKQAYDYKKIIFIEVLNSIYSRKRGKWQVGDFPKNPFKRGKPF